MHPEDGIEEEETTEAGEELKESLDNLKTLEEVVEEQSKRANHIIAHSTRIDPVKLSKLKVDGGKGSFQVDFYLVQANNISGITLDRLNSVLNETADLYVMPYIPDPAESGEEEDDIDENQEDMFDKVEKQIDEDVKTITLGKVEDDAVEERPL